MQDAQTWIMLSKHLGNEENEEEKELFTKWLEKSENNKIFFQRIKAVWDDPGGATQNIPLTLREKFSLNGIKNYIVKLALGNFIGFVVGMWVTSLFSHYVLERKSIKNLFGLAKRKQVEVNTIPEWLQGLFAILIGFIVLELINHFFQSNKHVQLWNFVRNGGKKK